MRDTRQWRRPRSADNLIMMGAAGEHGRCGIEATASVAALGELVVTVAVLKMARRRESRPQHQYARSAALAAPEPWLAR